MQPLVYFRAEAPLITRAYYITRYACHRVTITFLCIAGAFFSLCLSTLSPSSLCLYLFFFLFPTVSPARSRSKQETASKKWFLQTAKTFARDAGYGFLSLLNVTAIPGPAIICFEKKYSRQR